ncbi:toll/interleukin-1 receptor domain-containing protein [Bacillus sp. 1P10SD]|uniref:toll/interleukin-1 receptor domain-containing protein n=1 Tax=Bacillus sp. 1P10SD TaxID=3132265 RepID=UPI0039A40206
MGEVFISYSTKDTEIATKVYNSLLEEGFTCWFAPNDIPPGGDYASRITQALDKFRFVLVIVSQHSGSSEHVKREVTLASENNKTIIPFRIDSVPLSEWMRFYISTLNWLEANENNIDDSITILIEKIRSMYSLHQYETNAVIPHYGKSIHEVKGTRGSAKAKSFIYQIKTQELYRTKTVHVPFPKFEIAKDLLKEKGILFLQSEKHTGKFTTAMCLLNEINIDNHYQIFPNISLEELINLPFEKNAGYIIDNISPDTLLSINGFSLKKLSEHIQTSHSFLVITTNNGTRLEQGSEYFIKHEPPADIQRLIQNHVNLVSSPDSLQSQIAQLMQDLDLNSFITNDFLPRDSEELVNKLSSIVNGNFSTKDFLSSLTQNVNKRIEGWFETNRSIEQYALILSLAVFNESQYTFLVDRTEELKGFLLSETQLENIPSQEAPLGKSFIQQLNEISAETYTSFINTTTGNLQDQFVRFKTKEDATAVLIYIWTNYPHLKEVILEWMEILLAGANKYTNEKIINALVELSNIDPLTINNKVIQAWANHKEAYYRILSINLLLEMSEYKENLVYIDKLVNYWASLSNNTRLQWTAAVAYGTPIGIYLYPNSFVNLAAIYHVQGRQLGDVVYESMKYLFEYGKHDDTYLLSVPYLFKIWLEDYDKNAIQKHEILNLFYSLLMNMDNLDLTILLNENEIRHELLPLAISEGLQHWKLREMAGQVMKHFFKIAHDHPALYESLKLFTFSLLIKGGSELKQSILTLLYEVLQGPYKQAAVPIVAKIIEISERK